ncbi:hypothetical protein [Hydrogenophaga atypica]|uniref:hypothetical protein n=1 Tax=Hydrogenophaga atypica TaxID=249409 RepID=UPI0036D39AF7
MQQQSEFGTTGEENRMTESAATQANATPGVALRFARHLVGVSSLLAVNPFHEVLGKALEGHDDMDREAAAIFLRKLTTNPKLADEVADKLEGLLGGGGADRPMFSRKVA